jgi:UDP-N-acetylmuramyl pentapeptide phosphotransferase/UDP-N-acetylglucosamine-1-phosphate transferase/glycosyltransferase involved in cell wall biosynthesis
VIEFLRNLPYKTYIGLFLCSLLAGYWLVPRVMWLARGLGLSARAKPKEGPLAPSLGGLVVGIPFIAGISLLLLLRNQVSDNMYMVPLQMRGLFFGACLILVLGFLQDLLQLNRYLRVALQAAVAALAYYYGFRLGMAPDSDLGNFFFTLAWIIGLINLFDLLNRLNNLFVGFALLLVLSLLGAAHLLDQYRTIVVCCLLSGSLLGLLSYDSSTRPNLGSTGTFFLGFVLAITTLQSHIVDGLYDLLLFALGTSLLILLLVLKSPIHLPRLAGYSPGLHLRRRSLHYFKQAFALKLETATTVDENWSLLCRAAQEFNYQCLVQKSSTGERLREWSTATEGGEFTTLPLKCAGGTLLVQDPFPGAGALSPERRVFFATLVELFDRNLEKVALAQIAQKKNSLRVLLVNRYFSGMSATGQILEDLAQDLDLAGAAVTVLTGGLSYENHAILSGRNELVSGVHVCRVPATHFGRSTSLNRVMDFLFFYLFATTWILRMPSERYTHIVAFTDPPLIAIAGYLAKKIKGWRFIYNVQDLYPETALALGILKEGWFFRLCDRINKALLREADAVVAIGQKMAAHLRERIGSSQRIEVIHNWADGRKILPIDRGENSLAEKLRLKDVYTVIYAGNMGLAQEIDVLVQLITAFKGRQDIQFLFMGGGVRHMDLEKAVDEYGIGNVAFASYQERTDLPRYLALADIGIVTLSPALEGLAIPTRTYSYLAAGIPILAIAHQDSELKLFADQGLGAHFAPSNVEKIAEFLDREARQGRKGRNRHIRSYCETHFERSCQTQKFLALLEQLHRGVSAPESRTPPPS